MFTSPKIRPLPISLFVVASGMLCVVGCGDHSQPVVSFEPNLVHALKYQIGQDIPMEQASKDAAWLTQTMFGTPDDPRLPEVITEDEDLAAIVKIDRLMRASGPSEEEGRGLYRKHCVVCHGVSGNGRGPTAAVQVPYPRDYRMGVFKFKSTPRGVKPLREDLAKLIRGGIAGTAMKPIPELTEEDVQSLVDYVIYLSWRGELERTVLDDAMFELDLEAGDRILNYEFAEQLARSPDLRSKLEAINEDVDGDELADYEQYLAMDARLNSDSGLKSRLEQAAQSKAETEDSQLAADLEAYENYQDLAQELSEDAELKANLEMALQQTTAEELINYERYVESWEIAEGFVADIGDAWLDAEDEVLQVPDPPPGFPLAESHADFVQLSQGDKATELAASVKRGQELFVGKVATCSKCHGEQGLGNGQTTDYDDWTKDWTSRVGLKPEDRESLIPLLARGALPPRNAIPRNFAEGIFRGGSTSQDLYRRIMLGIDGTPMPAATFVEGQFEKDDVWHLINFIRSLQQSDGEEPTPPRRHLPPSGSRGDCRNTAVQRLRGKSRPSISEMRSLRMLGTIRYADAKIH